MNVTYHLRGGRHAELGNADRHSLDTSVVQVVTDPSGRTLLAGRTPGSPPPVTFDNADVVRIVIDMEA